jgi:hypothetical protein
MCGLLLGRPGLKQSWGSGSELAEELKMTGTPALMFDGAARIYSEPLNTAAVAGHAEPVARAEVPPRLGNRQVDRGPALDCRRAAATDALSLSGDVEPAVPDPERPIWAVRLDRPDGTHSFVGPEPSEPAAQARSAREQRHWGAAGLWAPSASVVAISAKVFIEHARDFANCSSTQCPSRTRNSVSLSGRTA